MKSLSMILAVLALLAGSAFAQTAPYVEGTIANAPGSDRPNASVALGLESNTKYLLIDVNGSFNTANVINGAGYTGTMQGEALYKLFGVLLAGGGANWVVNTSGFSAVRFLNTARESANPFVAAGLKVGRFRTIAAYQFNSPANALPNQRFFTLTTEYGITKHTAFVVPLGVNSYKNGIPARVTVVQAGAGLKYSF